VWDDDPSEASSIATGRESHRPRTTPGADPYRWRTRPDRLNQAYSQLHLQAYCDEWVFRFNRSASRSRGRQFLRLLENAVQTAPLPYAALTPSSRPRSMSPTVKGHSGSMRDIEINDERRPWKT
jgi:hypothetical protein